MIVVAIIAIIVTMALPVYSNYVIRAKISEALNVANAAKSAVSTSCQETPNLQDLDNGKMGFESAPSNYVESINISGVCLQPVITVVTRQTGASPDPTLTITGYLNEGQMDFTCSSSGPNRHVPETCRS
jgi:type IV pilus assembly protein PilA